VTPLTCWNTPCTPQKQPPAKTAVSVWRVPAGSSTAGAGMTTAGSAAPAWPKCRPIASRQATPTLVRKWRAAREGAAVRVRFMMRMSLSGKGEVRPA
jgi:hypothetical protein